eukprot:137233_1
MANWLRSTAFLTIFAIILVAVMELFGIVSLSSAINVMDNSNEELKINIATAHPIADNHNRDYVHLNQNNNNLYNWLIYYFNFLFIVQRFYSGKGSY